MKVLQPLKPPLSAVTGAVSSCSHLAPDETHHNPCQKRQRQPKANHRVELLIRIQITILSVSQHQCLVNHKPIPKRNSHYHHMHSLINKSSRSFTSGAGTARIYSSGTSHAGSHHPALPQYTSDSPFHSQHSASLPFPPTRSSPHGLIARPPDTSPASVSVSTQTDKQITPSHHLHRCPLQKYHTRTDSPTYEADLAVTTNVHSATTTIVSCSFTVLNSHEFDSVHRSQKNLWQKCCQFDIV